MYQNLVLVGRVGQTPELRMTGSGQSVAHFSVAVNRVYTDQEGARGEQTTWFRVTTWGKLAETCAQYLTKGRLVLVEGTVNASAYVDQGGKARASLEVTASAVRFLGPSNGEKAEAAPTPAEEAAPF